MLHATHYTESVKKISYNLLEFSHLWILSHYLKNVYPIIFKGFLGSERKELVLSVEKYYKHIRNKHINRCPRILKIRSEFIPKEITCAYYPFYWILLNLHVKFLMGRNLKQMFVAFPCIIVGIIERRTQCNLVSFMRLSDHFFNTMIKVDTTICRFLYIIFIQ